MEDKGKMFVGSQFWWLKYALIFIGIALISVVIFLHFSFEDIEENLTSEALYIYSEEGFNEEINADIGEKKVSIVCSDDSNFGCNLKVNEEVILNNAEVQFVYRIGNMIVILADENTSNSRYLYFINSDGTVNNVISNKSENALIFRLSSSLNDIKIEDTKITFYMTSVHENKKIMVSDGSLIDVIDEANKVSQYNINDNTVVAAKYEIEYLGNGKFREMKTLESTTYKSLVDSVTPIVSELVYAADENKRSFPIEVMIDKKSVILDSYMPEPGSLPACLKIGSLETGIELSDGLRHVSRIYIMGDLIVVESVGTDINSTIVRMYDIGGNLIESFLGVNKNSLSFAIGSFMENGADVSISENKITIFYTSTTHGISIMMEDKNVFEVLSQSDEIANYGIVDTTTIEFVAEYEYLGNGNFSEMKVVKECSYKELKDKLNSFINS